jgi:hypothetical protein
MGRSEEEEKGTAAIIFSAEGSKRTGSIGIKKISYGVHQLS